MKYQSNWQARALGIFFVGAVTLLAQDGAAIYKTNCAHCHDTPSGRVPPVSALRSMPPPKVIQALETGSMQIQAKGLSAAEKFAVVTYLATPAPKPAAAMPASALCQASSQEGGSHSQAASWSGWGANAENTRFQQAAAAGISPSDVPKLKLKWAFGLGEGTTVRSQAAAGDGRVFIADLNGGVYGLDPRTGCMQWSFKADATVRSALVFGTPESSGGRPALYFGDQQGNAYALDAANGKLQWKQHVTQHFAAMITGASMLHGDVVYVPISSYEEVLAASPSYECCTFRGAVAALDAATGKCLWTAHTIPDQKAEPAAATDKGSGAAAKTHGPSGAAVWSSPTFDEKLGRVYVATGDNYSDPPSTTSDAVLAFDAKTGALVWSKQLTSADVYNLGGHANGHDFDFGQSPILVSLPNGKRELVIGQKSGMAHALDPDQAGAVLWQARLGKGGPLGGIQWGSAADGDKMYVAVADLSMKGVPDKTSPQGYRLELDPAQGGGLFALRLSDGQQAWSAKPASCGARPHCSPAQSAPVTAIPGVVFSGSVDGHLRAYAADSGAVIWDADTARDYEAVNGQKAHGGSLDVAGPVVAGGMLYVTSGYSQWGGMPGNVLLAFSVDGK